MIPCVILLPVVSRKNKPGNAPRVSSTSITPTLSYDHQALGVSEASAVLWLRGVLAPPITGTTPRLRLETEVVPERDPDLKTLEMHE
jgi:hypothetical protein